MKHGGPSGAPPLAAEPRSLGSADAKLAAVAGIGPKRLAALHACGLDSFLDVLFHLPYRYEDLRRRDRIADLREGMSALVEGILHGLKTRSMPGRGWRRMTTAMLKDDGGGQIRVVWFNLHGTGMMPEGEPLLVHGRVNAASGGALEMAHPEIYRYKNGPPPAIRPIYRLPSAISQRLFATIVSAALTRGRLDRLAALPQELQTASGWPDLTASLTYLHQPPENADPQELTERGSRFHQALAFDEMFAFQIALARERKRHRGRAGASITGNGELSRMMRASLPFRLTAAQDRAIAEIAADLSTKSQMNRLLIGDVGSGKTIVAFDALLRTIGAGWQAVMMAPTELLAEQHFENFSRLCPSLSGTSALVTGRVAGAARSRVRRALQRGDIAVAFGTHALIQQEVRLKRLGLAVIDEQHRFGVFDRARLIARGSQANVLLLSATPIPRSLALTLLRNLDVSTLDEIPPGRTPVITRLFDDIELAEVDQMCLAALERGERIYYVMPLIDGDEEDAASVINAARRLSNLMAGFGIGIVHGRLRPAEKERVMRQFRNGAIGVLVATTVVEVGVDIPEATVIVIEAAERYGLAQLHQLRGRVGRGTSPSTCCLVISSGSDQPARSRLARLAASRSGIEVAELDLRTRGPGDLFGARQTGALPLRFGSFIRDLKLIEQAGELAERWLCRDPDLNSPASAGTAAAVNRLLAWGFSLNDIG